MVLFIGAIYGALVAFFILLIALFLNVKLVKAPIFVIALCDILLTRWIYGASVNPEYGHKLYIPAVIGMSLSVVVGGVIGAVPIILSKSLWCAFREKKSGS